MKTVITKNKQNIFLFIFLLIVVSLIMIFVFPRVLAERYIKSDSSSDLNVSLKEIQEVFQPSYIKTPEPVKGIYMTSWVASNKAMRENLVKIIDETEINTVVIDIKDYSGKIVFRITNPELKKFGSEEVRINDLQEFVETLHKKGIYVVGRVAVFQDAYFVSHRPDLAVKTKNGSQVWKDRKGISWIDAGSHEYWDYIILVAKESHKLGFDEINFDYIRFPSDGNMQDISFPFSSTTPKATVMKNFFEYVHNKIYSDPDLNNLKTSADLFGMVTNTYDDMGIGQVLENALPYFDYIMPMVYPSHYPANFQGYKEPESYPYEIITFAMKEAVVRSENLASTTGQSKIEYKNKLRPWLQDFGLRVKYGATEVRAQIKATNDLGLTSWILWSPSNKYTVSALNKN
ncbi:MAG TPA: putative glycoside hydrolase [Parcubacteria group bacterium]|nr:putative glycoside hydrolase [Parcubacteria group bacterium]